MSIIDVAIDINAPLAVTFAMVRGAFRHVVHDHYFKPAAGGTRMRDMLDFTAPFGVLGTLVDKLVLTAYLSRFLENRAQALKQLAESDAGQRFIVK